MTWIFLLPDEPQHKRKANPLRRAVLHQDKRITRIFFTAVLPLVRKMGKREISVPLQTLCPPVCL